MYLSAPQPFRLECDWLNAQAFRWTERDGWFHGIVGGQLIRVRDAADGGIEFEGDASADAVKYYFRLNQEDDIRAVHAALIEADPEHMPGLIKDYGHIRVLRQDPWECLVAYICSANASVDSIRTKLNKLAKAYGKDRTLDGVSCRAVPSAEQLKAIDVKKLRDLGLGLSHIPDTIHKAATDITTGKLDLKALSDASMSLVKARARLKNDRNDKRKGYHGIGDKIADCVCLFSLARTMRSPWTRTSAPPLSVTGTPPARRTRARRGGRARRSASTPDTPGSCSSSTSARRSADRPSRPLQRGAPLLAVLA